MVKRTEYQARADRAYEESRKGQPKVSSFFVTEDDMAALCQLTEHFSESRKAVLVRAIHHLHESTFGKKDDNFS